jgi:hypothetical protein
VDIQICSHSTFEWERFMGSYSDFGMSLAYLLRPIGFKITDKGFHLRVPQCSGTKGGTILLSTDPNEVMIFLGLDVGRFGRGFCTETEVFSFLLSGHLGSADIESGKVDMNGLRKKDKVMVRKRAMFKRFLEGGLVSTSITSEGEPRQQLWTEEEARKAAFEQFDCEVEYDLQAS